MALATYQRDVRLSPGVQATLRAAVFDFTLLLMEPAWEIADKSGILGAKETTTQALDAYRVAVVRKDRRAGHAIDHGLGGIRDVERSIDSLHVMYGALKPLTCER